MSRGASSRASPTRSSRTGCSTAGSGRMLNPNVEQYKIAGALDCREIDVTLVSVWDGVNNTNSVGIGEPSTVPDRGRDRERGFARTRDADHEDPITPEVVCATRRETPRGKHGPDAGRTGLPEEAAQGGGRS